MSKKSSQKLLKAEAKKFLNIRDVKNSFKTPPDFRTELTPYQAKKIRGMINQVKNALGSKADEIVPITVGRKKFLKDNGFPTFARGVDLSGGEKINKGAKYIGGKFYYERGGALRVRSRLYTEGDDADLIESCKKILKDKPKGWKTSITAAGRVIGSAQNLSNEAAVRQAVYIFMKYAELSYAGEKRTRTNKDGSTYQQEAAHPSKWGMGVLFEKPSTGKSQNGKKKTGKGRKRG